MQHQQQLRLPLDLTVMHCGERGGRVMVGMMMMTTGAAAEVQQQQQPQHLVQEQGHLPVVEELQQRSPIVKPKMVQVTPPLPLHL